MTLKAPSGETADQVIANLVNRGAAVLMRQDPTPIPVTFARRLDPERLFYFTTGHDTFAGHVIRSDRTEVVHAGQAVAFKDKKGAFVAYLAPVDEQEPDPEAAKHLEREIQAWKYEFARNENLREFVLAEFRRHR